MPAFVCRTCDDLPGIDGGPLGPDDADAHEERGHEVYRLPDESERPGGPHGPPLRDPEGERDGLGGRVNGELSTFRGVRVGRRRGDY